MNAIASEAQTKQQQLNRLWKQQKGHVSLVTREKRKSVAAGEKPTGVRGNGEAAGTSKARTVKTCLRPKYRNGGPLSSGANLEPLATKKRKWSYQGVDPDIAVDTTDSNGDIIMVDCMTSQIKVEEI